MERNEGAEWAGPGALSLCSPCRISSVDPSPDLYPTTSGIKRIYPRDTIRGPFFLIGKFGD